MGIIDPETDCRAMAADHTFVARGNGEGLMFAGDFVGTKFLRTTGSVFFFSAIRQFGNSAIR